MRQQKSSTGSVDMQQSPLRVSSGSHNGGCMILNIFNKNRVSDVPQSLYAAIVSQARQPVFFLRLGFPDTVTGRFDCLALHVYLFSRRLVGDAHPHAASLNQDVFDQFVRDTDRALRELGVGDTSVAKRNKKLLRGFYAMVDEFADPLDRQDEALLGEKVAARFSVRQEDTTAALDATALAHYMIASDRCLKAQKTESILAGRLDWPELPQQQD